MTTNRCPTCGHRLHNTSKYGPLWDALDKVEVHGQFEFCIKNTLLPFNELNRHNWQELYRRRPGNRTKRFVITDVPNAMLFIRLR